jgi:superfamily II DNA or RNA helicase
MMRKFVSGLMVLVLISGNIVNSATAAEGLAGILPPPGERVALSAFYQPPLLVGLKVFPDNPLRFNFIIDAGSRKENLYGLRKASRQMVGYFLAGLTIPDDDVWVNLSPQEKDRIAPDALAATWMGRDMLAQDYLLKQVASALSYPESSLGRTFWADIYRRLQEVYGTTDIAVEVFNKVWVMPEVADIYEQQNMALIADSRLKVMMESDYRAGQNSQERDQALNDSKQNDQGAVSSTADDAIRRWLIPVLDEQVNQGKHFAVLRQIYHALILAQWFKRRLHDEIWSRNYIGHKKTAGIDVEDRLIKEKIYRRYLSAFKKGAYNYIHEEAESGGEVFARKYFSGGVDFGAALRERINFLSAQPDHKFANLMSEGRLVEVAAGVDYAQERPEIAKKVVTIYPGAVYREGAINGGDNPQEILSQNLFRTFPRFSGLVRMQLNGAGGFSLNDRTYWHARSGYQNRSVILVLEEGDLKYVYSERGDQLFPFTENFIYPQDTYQKDGVPVNPEGCFDLNSFLHARYPVFTGGIDKFRLNNRGGLHALGQSLWGAMRGYESAVVRLVVRENTIVEVYAQDGKRLYPFDENYIYSAEVDADGQFRLGELLTPGGLLVRDIMNNWLRKHPRFTGVVRKVRLDRTGGLSGFNTGFLEEWRLAESNLNPDKYWPWLMDNGYVNQNRQVLSTIRKEHRNSSAEMAAVNRVLADSLKGTYWYSMIEYAGDLVDVVMKDGSVVAVISAQGKKIYPYETGFLYEGSEYRQGQIVGGRLINPRGARDRESLNRVLKYFPGFSGVLAQMKTDMDGSLPGINGEDFWQKRDDRADIFLNMVMQEGKITAIYKDSDGTRLYPYDDYYVYEGASVDEHGQRTGGELLSPAGLSSRKAFNRLFLKYPRFSGFVERFPLKADGSLGMINSVRYARSFGEKGKHVQLQMEKGSLLAVFDGHGQRLDRESDFRGKTAEAAHDVYSVTQGNDGEWKRGKPLTDRGFSSRRFVNDWLGENPRQTCLVRTTLNSDGGLGYFNNGVLEEWRFYERGLDLKAILPRLIALGHISQDGRRVLSNLSDSADDFQGQAQDLREALRDSLNGFYWESFGGRENEEVSLVLSDGILVAAYDRQGKRFYPFSQGLFYSGAVYRNGKMEGGSLLNPRGSYGVRGMRSILGHLLSWTGVISRVPTDPRGRLGPWSGVTFWGGTRKDTQDILVDIVITDGKAVAVHQTQGGRQLYPFEHYYIYVQAVMDEGQRQGGDLLTPDGLYTRQALYSFLLQNARFSGVIESVPLSSQGALLGIPGLEAPPVFDKHRGETVSLRIEQGRLTGVFDMTGRNLLSVIPAIASGSESRRPSFKTMIDSGDARKLVTLFGVRGALRVMYGLAGTISPAQLVEMMPRFFEATGNPMPYSRQNMSVSRMVETIASVDVLRSSPSSDLEKILTRELFQTVYARVVEDHTFLEELEYAAVDDGISGLIYKVIGNILKVFHEVADAPVHGIKSATEPMFYQRAGIKFILDKKQVIIADKQGLGKTLQVLGAAVNAFDGQGARKVLIVAPKSALESVWKEQIAKHLTGEQPVHVITHKSDVLVPFRRKKIDDARFLIVNYELLQGESGAVLRDYLKKMEVPIDFIIVDEAHRLRNDNLVVQAIGEFDAPYKVLLSASAQYGRRIGKIFNLLHWLRPDEYPSRASFSANHFADIKRGLRDVLLRRHLDEVYKQMPALEVEYRVVRLEGEQGRLYADMEDKIRDLIRIEGHINSFPGLRLLTRGAVDTALIPRLEVYSEGTGETNEGVPGLLQVQTAQGSYRVGLSGETVLFIPEARSGKPTLRFPCTGGSCQVHVGEAAFRVSRHERTSASAKYQALDQIVEDVVAKEQESLVVFSGVIKVVEDLSRRYRSKGFEVRMIHGGLSRSQRSDILREFQEARTPVILVCTYQTMGESVNLTKAHYGVLVDSPWLGRDQIYGRLRRIGQRSDVRFFILQALGTIDQHIERVSSLAELVQDLVLDDGKALSDKEDVQSQLLSVTGQALIASMERVISVHGYSGQDGSHGLRANFGLLEVKESSRSASFDGFQLKGSFRRDDGEEIIIHGSEGLIRNFARLAPGDQRFLGRFIQSCLQREEEQRVKVRQTILWHILAGLTPGFGQIDYHGRMESMVIFSADILRGLMENPDMKKADLVPAGDVILDGFYNETMAWLDTANVFRMFSWMGLIPPAYYYEGELMRYDAPVRVFMVDGSFGYFDGRIVEQIAPGWRVVLPEEDDSGISGMMTDIRRFRPLDVIEEKRLVNQVRMGNRAAEEVLAGSNLRIVVQIARNAAFTSMRRLGRRTYGRVHSDQLYAEGMEWLVSFIRSYAVNQVDERMPLKDYLWARLGPRLYSRAFEMAAEVLKEIDDGPVFADDRDSPGIIDTLSGGDDPQGLVEAEDMFGQFLLEQGFNETDRRLIRLFVVEGYSQDQLLREFLEGSSGDPTFVDSEYVKQVISGFLEKMHKLGPQKVRALLNQDGPASDDEEEFEEADDAQLPPGGIDFRGRAIKPESTPNAPTPSAVSTDPATFKGFVPVVLGIRILIGDTQNCFVINR